MDMRKNTNENDDMDMAIMESEAEFERNRELYDARITLEQLREKYFDK